MKRLEIQIEDELHRVVYIDYSSDRIPHCVMTIHFVPTADEPYWRLYWWDFFANDGDKNDIRAYNSGSGGTHKEIQAPQWVDGYTGKYWLADDMEFNGEPKNAKRMKNPIRLKNYYGDSDKSINPFKIAKITNSSEYCDRCGHESVDFCDEHKYDDDEGNVRYKDDDSYAD